MSTNTPNPLLHVILYQPEIPFNTGSIGRTCVAVGAKLWLVRPLGFQIDDKHIQRAGLDYWKHLDWVVAEDWDDLGRMLELKRFWLLTKTARRPYYTADFQPGDALVFGSESSGLPDTLLREHSERCLRIPMRKEARCLNLAVSAGIVVYEAARQCGVE
jgi:tRNA (cytidine/uridine-2'-O-)-methyltransferase